MSTDKISEQNEIVATVNKYVEGCREGKSSIMKPAFLEEATMTGYLNGSLGKGSIENLFQAVDSFGADHNMKARIDIIEIDGSAAVARVTIENWHSINFVDFHSLVKIDNQWKIAAKIFNQY